MLRLYYENGDTDKKRGIHAISVIVFHIPNLIGLKLGSTQLTVYVIYKKKPESTKGPTVGKGDTVKMGASNYEEARLKDETVKVVVVLKKVKSLPKPVLNHEHMVPRILKTLFFKANNLPSPFWSTTPQQEEE
ncbi:hypothetical protein GmHk_03G008788 [Glycine max]|nr:hypothetical protein GmHk_03G008788 [Glycine max]